LMPNTQAMFSTLQEGDFVVVEKNPEAIGYGDLLAFGGKSEQPFIFRVIGKPADRVKVAGNRVYINDQLMHHKSTDSSFQYEEVQGTHHYRIFLEGSSPPFYPNINMTLHKGYYFLLGDNRHNANDSRVLGSIGLDQVKGRVVGIFSDRHGWLSGQTF